MKATKRFLVAFAFVSAAVIDTVSFSSLAQTSAAELPRLDPLQSLGIASVPKLCDIGGFETVDGATVARGLGRRCDTFNPMGGADIAKLGSLHLESDQDLRTKAEFEAKLGQMPPHVRYHLLNVLAGANSAAPAEIEPRMHEPKKANAALGGGKVEKLFADAYREFITLPSAKQAFRPLFLPLADRESLTAVFHCTIGNDRTGWAAAALPTLRGVPKETIMADFMRTDDYTLTQFNPVIDEFAAAGGDRAIAEAVFGVKAEHLEASFDEIQRRYGTIQRYCSEGLGLDAAGQNALRVLYAEGTTSIQEGLSK